MEHKTPKLIEAYILITLLLFAPKIGSYIDLSMITGLLIIVFTERGIVRFSKLSKNLCISAGIILAYNIIISLLNFTIDITFVGRMIRSLVSIVAIWMYVDKNDFTKEEWMTVLSNVILIHAVLVLITATVFVSWQEKLRIISSYAAHVRQFRSTGLLTGFDIAGLVCVLGLIFTVLKTKLSYFDIIKIAIFILATFFTSRFSLVLLFVSLGFYLITNLGSKENRMLKILFFFLIILCMFFAVTLFSATTTMQIASIKLPEQLSWINKLVEKIQYE